MKKQITFCKQIVERDNQLIAAASKIPYYPLAVQSGHGAIIEDVDNNQYIDMFSSAAVLNTGQSHPKVVKAIIEQATAFIHYAPPYTYNQSFVDLAQALIEITPGDFEKKVTFGLSGSSSIDGMIKLAKGYTGRSKIVSFIGAYHGSTYGALSLSAINLNMRRKIGPLLPDVYHIPYPYCYRCKFNNKEENCNLECLKELEEAFQYYLPPQEVAAIVIEPIAGDIGMVVPPAKYIQKLYRICKENGILFVVDEIQQGFGRTGKWFSIEHFNIHPDIIVMGKALASGMPISAIVAKKEIMQSLEGPAHAFTNMGNPVCCKAALATIDIIKEEKLMSCAEELGKHAKLRFLQMQKEYQIIGDVRGKGLSIGVELISNKKTKEKNKEAAAKICYRCWEKGVILTFLSGNILRVQPPLVITKKQLDTALDIIEDAIQEYILGRIPDEVLKVVKGW